jgi:hypothetical protein
VAGQIQVSDCAFTPLTSPAPEIEFSENATPTTPATNGLTLFTHSSTLQYVDDTSTIHQVATSTDLGAYLPLDGSGTMAGDVKMGGQSVTGIASVAGPTNSRTADNIVSNTSTGVAGNLPTFVSDKVIGDSGTALSSLATTLALSGYLSKAGGSMIGPIDMGATSITNVNYIYGLSNNSFVDWILSSPGGQVDGNIPAYSGVVNKFVADSGIAADSVVVAPHHRCSIVSPSSPTRPVNCLLMEVLPLPNTLFLLGRPLPAR